MRKQLDAVREVEEFLTRHNIRHLIMGGIANAVWGRVRVTHDADFKVLIGDLTIQEFVTLVGQHFEFRVPDAAGFARRTYVVPIYASNHIAVDLALGFLPFEEQAIEKAVIVNYHGVQFPACTAEDLIIHKAIAEREKDWTDIEGIVLRQGDKLDQAYIMHWLDQFGQVLERPKLVRRYRSLVRKLRQKSAPGRRSGRSRNR